MKKVVVLNLLILFALLLGACGLLANPTPKPSPTLAGFKGVVRIGGLFDLSGATATEGREYAAGAEAQVAYINSKGGLAGYKLELLAADFNYQAPLALELYQKMLKMGAVGVLSWTTADTLALTRQLKVPLFSTSYADNLVRDTKLNPYNFMISPSYADQMRSVVQWARINHPEPYLPNRRLGLAYIYSDDQPGRLPLQTGREYAAEQKLFWYHEGILEPELSQENIDFEVERLKKAQPDFCLIQADTKLTAQFIKTARQKNLDTKFIGLNYTAQPDFIELAGTAGENFMASNVIAYPESDANGVQQIKEFVTNRPTPAIVNLINVAKPDTTYSFQTKVTQRYVQGWVTAQVLAEGVRLAIVAQNAKEPAKTLTLDGDAVKAALETLRDFDTSGITAPLSFTPENHKGTNRLRFFRVEKGQWQPLTGELSLEEFEATAYKNQAPPTPTPTLAATPRPTTPVPIANTPTPRR
jgi:branched-chain amino acid transport system substrate-binding protein